MTPVDEIKNRLDIVEVIGAYVKLTRSGRSFKGLSPFQNERTPSFFVFPETQTFKDFSSGEQGDLFSFVMKKEGWTFGEALRELAQRAGVQLEERTPEQKKSQDHETRLREACAAAAQYFHQLLKSAPQAAACREYVAQKRHLSAETIDQWQLGFSLPEYQALTTYLTGRGFSVQELVSAGLVIENDEGRRYDRFRGRLMIPISDAKGQVIGFGSRSLDGSEPKYMNSPQTPIFDKGRLLFGLDRARNAIRNEQAAVLVEGYMDVIGTHQAGFVNVVAGMGTSLTEDQFRALERLAKRLVLALDADAAGNRAVLRGVDVARDALERTTALSDFGWLGYEQGSYAKLNADIRVALLPEGCDPDEMVLDAPEKWRTLIADAKPVIEHIIDKILKRFELNDRSSLKEREDAVRAVAAVLVDLAEKEQKKEYGYRTGLDYYRQMLARKVRLTDRRVAELIQDEQFQVRRRNELSRAKRMPVEARSKRESATQTSTEMEDGQSLSNSWNFADDAEAPVPLQNSISPNSAAVEKRTWSSHEQKRSDQIDLERHLVALLWRKPDLVRDANVALTRAELDTLSEGDFANPALREAFRQINRMVLGQPLHTTDADDDWLEMIADHVLAKQIEEDEVMLREEAVRTALRLRERNLNAEREQTTVIIRELGESNDVEAAARYNLDLRGVLIRLLRAQKALHLRSGIHAA